MGFIPETQKTSCFVVLTKEGAFQSKIVYIARKNKNFLLHSLPSEKLHKVTGLINKVDLLRRLFFKV